MRNPVARKGIWHLGYEMDRPLFGRLDDRAFALGMLGDVSQVFVVN